MLMENFKGANDLEISEAKREALIKTLHLMETGEIVHRRVRSDYYPPYVRSQSHEFTGHFNMARWNTSMGCQTVACIGGTAEMIGHVRFDFNGECDVSYALHDLFNPSLIGSLKHYKYISVEQAAQALRNYLTTGKADWDEILT